MGLCRAFGPQIAPGCDHPIQARSDSCRCEQCGVVCEGLFEACPSVWAAGPQPVVLASTVTKQPTRNPSADRRRAAVEDRPPLMPVPREVTDANPASVPARRPPSPGSTPTTTGDSTAGVVQRLEGAVDALRQEVAELRQALSQGQARVVSLVESKPAGPDEESVRPQIEVAVRKAVARRAADLEAKASSAAERLHIELAAVKLSHDDHLASLRAETDVMGQALRRSFEQMIDVLDARRRELDDEARALPLMVAGAVSASVDFHRGELEAVWEESERLRAESAAATAELHQAIAEIRADLGKALVPPSAGSPNGRVPHPAPAPPALAAEVVDQDPSRGIMENDGEGGPVVGRSTVPRARRVERRMLKLDDSDDASWPSLDRRKAALSNLLDGRRDE